jgi:hypothetical protein
VPLLLLLRRRSTTLHLQLQLGLLLRGPLLKRLWKQLRKRLRRLSVEMRSEGFDGL